MKNVRIISLCFLMIACSGLSHAQAFEDSLQSALHSFYEKNTPLKLSLFLNAERYDPGDTIFYKVYFLTARDIRPVADRFIINVSLEDNNGTIVARQQISVVDGHDFNQLAIPGGLPAGLYTLRAYNPWMYNFDHELIFSKKIAVGAIGKLDDRISSIRIYPESGSLVNGLASKVVVQGEPSDSIQLVSSDGRMVAKTKLSENGFGNFTIIAETGRRYDIRSDGKSFAVPDPQEDGAVLTINPDPDTKTFVTSLQVHSQSRYRRNPLRLILHIQGELHFAAVVSFAKSTLIKTRIDARDFPAGVGEIVLMTDDADIIARRLIYVPPDKITTSISPLASSLAPREKVRVVLKLTDNQNNLVEAKCAARVTLDEKTVTETDIVSSLYIQNDVGFDPFTLTDTSSPSIDDYLITKTWKRFHLDSLQSKKMTYPLNQFLRLSGRAVFADSGKPVPDSSVISMFVHKVVYTYVVHTGIDGRFDFTMLFDFTEADQIFYRVEHDGKVLPGVRIIPDEQFTIPSGVQPSKVQSSMSFGEVRNRINYSYGFYTRGRGRYKDIPPTLEMDREAGGADLTVRLSDYLLFPTMSETLREVIPMLQHRVIDGKNVVRFYRNDPSGNTIEYVPLFVIDGVMTDDTNYFLSLNPSDVEKISIVYNPLKLGKFGTLGKGGFVIVKTKIAGNFANVPRPETMFTYYGLSERKEINTTPQQIPSRVPDLRTTLYWNPGIQTVAGSAVIEFYTSDVPGNYEITIEGITTEGKPFSYSRKFNVAVPAGSD